MSPRSSLTAVFTSMRVRRRPCGRRADRPDRIGWIVAGATTIATCVITLVNMLRHLRAYTVPSEQRQIVRILLLPAVCPSESVWRRLTRADGIISFCSYRWYRSYCACDRCYALSLTSTDYCASAAGFLTADALRLVHRGRVRGVGHRGVHGAVAVVHRSIARGATAGPQVERCGAALADVADRPQTRLRCETARLIELTTRFRSRSAASATAPASPTVSICFNSASCSTASCGHCFQSSRSSPMQGCVTARRPALNLQGVYCPGEYSVHYAAVYIESIDFVSISVRRTALRGKLMRAGRPLCAAAGRPP